MCPASCCWVVISLLESRSRQVGIEGKIKDRRKRLNQAVLDVDSKADTAKHQDGETRCGGMPDERHGKSRQKPKTSCHLQTSDQGTEMGDAVAHVFPLHGLREKARCAETKEGNGGEADQERVHWIQPRVCAA
jgi:hypothetical protein